MARTSKQGFQEVDGRMIRDRTEGPAGSSCPCPGPAARRVQKGSSLRGGGKARSSHKSQTSTEREVKGRTYTYYKWQIWRSHGSASEEQSGEEEARLADVREPYEDKHLVTDSRKKTKKNEILPFSAK